MTLFTAMQTETSCLNNVLLLPMVKREEPMDVSCNATPSDIFKVPVLLFLKPIPFELIFQF